jgi:hypothetical protein
MKTIQGKSLHTDFHETGQLVPNCWITRFICHAFVVKNFQLLHGFTAAREHQIVCFFLLTLDDLEHVKTKHKFPV